MNPQRIRVTGSPVRFQPLKVTRGGNDDEQRRIRAREEARKLSQQASRLRIGDPQRDKYAIRIKGLLQGHTAPTASERMTQFNPNLKVRRGVNQLTQPAIGSFAGMVGKLPSQLISLGGGAIEQATPFNGIGRNIQKYGANQARGVEQVIGLSRSSPTARPGENRAINMLGQGIGSLAGAAALGGSTLTGGGKALLGRGVKDGVRLAGARRAALAPALFGTTAAGENFRAAKEAGTSTGRALTTATAAGAAEAILETIMPERVGGKAIRNIFSGASREATEEIAQSLAGEIIADIGYTDTNYKEAVTNALAEGLVGAVLGGGLAGTNQAISSTKPTPQDPRTTAQRSSEAFNAPVIRRDPELNERVTVTRPQLAKRWDKASPKERKTIEKAIKENEKAISDRIKELSQGGFISADGERTNKSRQQPESVKITNPSQSQNTEMQSLEQQGLAHQMPDGSVMQGPEHEGAVPGSTVRIDKESQPQQQIRVREDQSTARNQNQPISLRRQQQSSQKLLPEQPPLNLLSTGSIRLSPAQAKRRFKALDRRGSIYEVENELATGSKPFYVSPGGTVRVGNDGTIPVHQRGGEKNISVDRNPVYFEPTPEYLSDVSGFEAYMKDFYRIMEKVFTPGSSQFKKLEEEVIKPFDQVAKGEYVDLQQNVLDDLQKQIVDGLGIKKGSAESVATQMFGEGDITFDQLVQQFGEGRANDIVAADKFFRSRYDELLTRINDGRRKIYGNNPDKLIPRRSDYYRHFREIQDGFQGLKNIFSQQADIPPELAGTSEFTQPKSRFLSLAQRRMGAESDVDAVAGYLNYVPAAAYAIHIDPQIDRLRTFKQNVVASLTDKREEVQAVRDEMSRAIANQEWEAYDVAKDRLDSITENGKFDDTAVNTFLEFLDDYTNDLAGKTNPADRFPQKVLGRKTFRVIDWMNKRVKANVILGNASSSIAQFFNMPQGIAQAGPKHAYKGAVETFKSITQPNEAMQQSTFIKERYFDAYKNFDTSLFEKSRDFAAWMVQVGDEIGTKYIWNSMYQKALSENVKDPVRYADVETRKLVAGRGVGEVPLAQKSRVFQMAAPFQLEVQNLWYVLGDQTKKGQFGKLITFAIASFLMNEAARSIRGSDVSFNPIEALLDAYGAFEDEEDKAVGAARAGGRIAGEFLSNVPFGQQLASVYPEFGVSLGDETVTREELFGDADPTRFGTGFGGGTLVGRGVQEPLFRLLPPFGGQQIKRTIEGVNTTSKGYSETRGDRIRYVTNDNPIRVAQRAVFGQYSTPNARRYFDEVQTPLGETDSEQLKALSRDQRQGFYDDVISRREVSRESREQGETLTQNRNELAERVGGEYKDYISAYELDETKRDPATIAKMAIKGTGYEGLPDEVLNQYLKENNLKREDIEYALDSDKKTDEKLADFKQQNFQSRDEMLAYLQAGRIKSIDGNYRANERLLRDLYDQGVIDNNELYGLLSIEDGQYKPSSSSSGSSRSGGRIKIKKPSKTTASAQDGLKILNSIASPNTGTPISQSDLDRIIKIARTA